MPTFQIYAEQNLFMSKKKRIPTPPTTRPTTPTAPSPSKQANAKVRSSTAPSWWMWAAIIGLTFLAFVPSLQNGFVWDDQAYIVDSTLISPLDWAHFKMMWTTPFGGNYHPLTMLSLAIERAVVGTSPFLYHLNNLLLHIANSLLVFVLLKRLSTNQMAAFIAALFFGIHPLHVESVAWATERKDVLYTLFVLAAFWYYLDYLHKERQLKYLVLSIVLFVAACLSKGMAVVFPVLLLLTDYFLLRRPISMALFVEKIPYLLVALVTGIVAISAQKEAGADLRAYLGQHYSGLERLLFIVFGFVFYWVKMILPVKLSLLYSYPLPNTLTWEYYAAPLVLSCLVGLFWWQGKRNPHVAWGVLFFVICILPVIQLLPVGNTVVAERYFYLSSVGPLYLLGLLLASGLRSQGWQRTAASGLLVVFTLGFTGQTFAYNRVWKNQLTVFTHAVEQFPTSVMGLRNIGGYYFREKDYASAIPFYQKAQQYSLVPNDLTLELGQCYYYQKDYQKASENLVKAYDAKMLPELDVWMLGEAFSNLGQIDKAMLYMEKALAARPNEAQLLGFMGLMNLRKEQYAQALPYLQRAIAANPQYSEAYVNMSFAYLRMGQVNDAIAILEKASQAAPNNGNIFKNLGLAYERVNNLNKARDSWRKALEFFPQDGDLYYNIGTVYERQGNLPEAINWYRQGAQRGNSTAIQMLQNRGIKP